MKRRLCIKFAAGIMVSCLCLTGTAFAQNAQKPQRVMQAADEQVPVQAADEQASGQEQGDMSVSPKSADMPEETQPAIRTIGKETKNTAKLTVTNGTGKNIEYISIFEYDPDYDPSQETVKLQEALISQGYLDDVADGSFGPMTQAAVEAFRLAKGLSQDGGADKEMLTLLYGTYDDGNLLPDKEVIQGGETVLALYENASKPKPASIDAPAEDANKVQSVPEFHARLKFEGTDHEYILHVLPTEETAITIKADDRFAYIEYTDAATGTLISTFEAENAIYDAANQVYTPPVEEVYSYDDGYDDGYYDDSSYYDDGGGDDGWTDDTGDGTTAQDGCIEDALFW